MPTIQRSRPGLVALALALLAGCSAERQYQPPPPPNFEAREIPFEDTEAFDALLEAHLTNGAPAVRVLLDAATPDWPDRLVVWLRAYRDGGKVRPPTGRGGVASLVWLAAGANTATEARRLLEASLDKVEQAAVTAATWWENERERQRRVDLLRPYLLDAQRDAARGDKYTLVFYNGRYE